MATRVTQEGDAGRRPGFPFSRELTDGGRDTQRFLRTEGASAEASGMTSHLEDRQASPQRTAVYLQKLSRLRDSLLRTETANLSAAIARTVLPRVSNCGPVQPLRNKKSQSSPLSAGMGFQAGPDRHLRMQLEKTAEIERRRGAGDRSPPPLLISVQSIGDKEDKNKSPRSQGGITKRGASNGKFSTSMDDLDRARLDPFDPSVLEPTDPMDRLFNMERLRLLNAAMLAEKQQLPKVDAGKKPGTYQRRQKDLLTPRRGTEWFITGRYKHNERKPPRTRPSKHGPQHAANKRHPRRQHAPRSYAASSYSGEAKSQSLDLQDSPRSEPTGRGSLRSGVGRYPPTGTVAPATTPVLWVDRRRVSSRGTTTSAGTASRATTGGLDRGEGTSGSPPPAAAGAGVADSTTNLMVAIMSTAEANKVAGRPSRSVPYDPNNYRPISPEGPGKEDPRVLEASEDNGDNDSKPPTLQHRDSDLSITKLSIAVEKENSGLTQGSILKPVRSGNRAATNSPSGKQVNFKVESRSETNLNEAHGIKHSKEHSQSMTLFAPDASSLPQINLREATFPEMASAKEEVSLKKIVRQNELREKEVNNLMEDIKELNRISDDLQKAQHNN